MILNVGCGGRSKDQKCWYGDVRIDIVNYPNVTHVMDAQELKFKDASFDRIVSYEVLEHLDSPIKALMEMERVLKQDGEIEISIPNIHYWRRFLASLMSKRTLKIQQRNPQHKCGWDLVAFRNLVSHVELKIVEVTWLNWYGKPKNKLSWLDYLFKFSKVLGHTHVMFMLKKKVD